MLKWHITCSLWTEYILCTLCMNYLGWDEEFSWLSSVILLKQLKKTYTSASCCENSCNQNRMHPLCNKKKPSYRWQNIFWKSKRKSFYSLAHSDKKKLVNCMDSFIPFFTRMILLKIYFWTKFFAIKFVKRSTAAGTVQNKKKSLRPWLITMCFAYFCCFSSSPSFLLSSRQQEFLS